MRERGIVLWTVIAIVVISIIMSAAVVFSSQEQLGCEAYAN